LFTGNCQSNGLEHFMKIALPHLEIRNLPFLATFFNEFSEEKIAEEHAWADLVFFHHKADNPQNYPTKQPKIPLAVWYQSGPFITHATNQDWLRLLLEFDGDVEKAVQQAPIADMGYEARWNHCLERMIEKEINEEVPRELRISDLMEYGKDHQLQLTSNHPASFVFYHWTKRICHFLGVGQVELPSEEYCLGHPNLAGLPCEESATSGAREILGLNWGGRPEDDQSGRDIARERLSLLKSE
jgi:hypothetical protein